VALSAVRYPRGIYFLCSPGGSGLEWNVAGSARFSAVFGIDDTTDDGFGAVVYLGFYDQDGRQLLDRRLESVIGHPKKVSLNLAGVVSLRMTCEAYDAETHQGRSTIAVLGDPLLIQR
jgi:hypothetical protein